MKVLYLPAYFFPEQAASSSLNDQRNQAFADAGFDTIVYVPTPCRGVTREERRTYCSKRHRHEKMYGEKMLVNRFSMYSEGKNPILRALRYTLCWIKQFNRGLYEKNVDCIYLASTPPIQGILGGVLKKLKKVPFVYNLQDIFPDSLIGTGMTHEGSSLWKIGRCIENYTYRNSDKVIVISQDFKRNIMAKGVPEEKIEVIYNWVDENAITPVKDEENELFEEFGISRDKFRVVYAGNLGNAQNIEIIVNAAQRLKDNKKIEFIIFGKGGLEDDIKAIKAKEQLDNLKILPLQPYERVAKVYGLGNVCIVACKSGLGGAAMPSKTWSIMSSGRAVLANFDEGELKEIVENNNCGVYTKAGDLEGFVAAIEDLSQHPERCAEMGRNGRQFILENLTREVGTRKYVEVIKSVVSEYRKSKER
jgi:glycosyltransferase involved in cell wall biosynthesis